MRRLYFIAAAFALLLGAVMWRLAIAPSPAPALPVLDSLGGEFALLTTQGKRASLSEYRGKVVILGFGFTHCPDVCPTMMSRVRAALLELGNDALNVQPILVTLDPERDTVDVLGKYVAAFHPSIVGMTGTQAEVDAVAALFKVYSEKVASESGAAQPYSLAHSGHLYVLDEHGRVRATLAESVQPVEIAATVRRVLIAAE